MKYKNKRIICLAMVFVCIFSCLGCEKNKDSGGAVICNTYLTKEMKLENIVTAAGMVEGSDSVSITSNLNAKVTKLNVDVGSIVKSGDILCEFDRTEFQRQLDTLNLEMDLTSKKSKSEHDTNVRNLTYAENQKDISLRIAQREIDENISKCEAAYRRYDLLTEKQRDLYNKIAELDKKISEAEDPATFVSLRDYVDVEYNTVSTELEQLNSSLIEYENAVANAQDNYNRIVIECDHAIQVANDIVNAYAFQVDTENKLKLEALEKKIGECTVVAPRDGIITSLSVKEGSLPTNESIMTIANNSSLAINATVYETDIFKIIEGQKCEISILANNEKVYTGNIIKVAKIPNDMVEDSSAYSVKISINNPDEFVIIGMNVQISIITEIKEKTIAVPYEAIGSDEEGNTYVFVGDKNSDGSYTLSKRNISTGIETSYLSEIYGDINSDEYIMFPAMDLSDGDKVKVKDTYSSDDFNE